MKKHHDCKKRKCNNNESILSQKHYQESNIIENYSTLFGKMNVSLKSTFLYQIWVCLDLWDVEGDFLFVGPALTFSSTIEKIRLYQFKKSKNIFFSTQRYFEVDFISSESTPISLILRIEIIKWNFIFLFPVWTNQLYLIKLCNMPYGKQDIQEGWLLQSFSSIIFFFEIFYSLSSCRRKKLISKNVSFNSLIAKIYIDAKYTSQVLGWKWKSSTICI